MASTLQSRVNDLIGNRPLSTRSVLATALLGANQPRLAVAELVGVASLFGISAGAARTCLWRMVTDRELTADGGTYALAGRLSERRQRVDEAYRIDDTTVSGWDGTWELAVVALDRRSAADRLELRKAAAQLHLAELREGVWIRPENLDPLRLPASRVVLERQCTHFHDAKTGIAPDKVRALFALDDWAADAEVFIEAMNVALKTGARDDLTESLRHDFALSIAVVRHLQLDPLLPLALVPKRWPGPTLRSTYRRFDDAFKQRLNATFRRTSGPACATYG